MMWFVCLIDLVGNTSRDTDRIFPTIVVVVHGRLLLLLSVLLPARLNEKWDERSLFRVLTLYMFPTRTCRDSSN